MVKHAKSCWYLLASQHAVSQQSAIKSCACAGCFIECWLYGDIDVTLNEKVPVIFHVHRSPPRLLAEAAVICVSQFWSNVTSAWRRLDPNFPIPCASYFLWSESDLLQGRKMGTCCKYNLIEFTFLIWAWTHPVSDEERTSVCQGCWISCSCFPLRNVIESPLSCLILWAKSTDMASSAKCLLKWLDVATVLCWCLSGQVRVS